MAGSQAAVQEEAIERIKYPAIGKLSKMGVTFRPSVRYKIDSSEFNILKDPSIATVKAQVNSNRSLARKSSNVSEDNQLRKPRNSPPRKKKQSPAKSSPMRD